ncbi:hypothetical protein CEXT_158081 [Caerostris extrusa]|uniref:Uncharacterized protein n=1 Tax=Caerostris extrusa TaxID=172846 RepID=A0AAV4XYU0_CAEEX|nr:hypothetical protein CEXT_158081 [Caerostris extrusa]
MTKLKADPLGEYPKYPFIKTSFEDPPLPGIFNRVWWLTVGEYGAQNVEGKGEGDDCLRAGAHYHAFHPQPDECHERPERLHDVGIVRSTLGDHAAQLSIAERPDHGEDPRRYPHHEAQPHGPRAQEHPFGGHEDTRSNDTADYDSHTVQKPHLGFQANSVAVPLFFWGSAPALSAISTPL